MSASGSIVRFLGDSATGRGPFGLLGVEPDRCEPGDIKAALDRQLVRVEQHPEGDTPEADDVRLALHAAAAQLLDPAVRWHLLAAQRSLSSTRDPLPARTSAPVGDSAEAGRAPPPPGPVDPAAPAWIVAPNRNRREIRGVAAAIIAMILLIGISGSILLVLLSRTGGRQPGAAATSTPTQAPIASVPAPAESAPDSGSGSARLSKPDDATPPASQRPPDVVSVTMMLRGASQRVSASPERAQAEFAQAAEWLEANWVECPLPQRRAANDAILECIYAAFGRPTLAASMIETIASPAAPLGHADRQLAAGEIWPAAWSCGMLTRLSRERSLPTQLSMAIDHALITAMGNDRPRSDLGFEAGAAAALGQIPLRLLSEPVPGQALPVAKWVAAIGALAADPLAQEEIMVRGLDEILLTGPAPDADPGAYEAIRSLTVAIKWRRGGLGRFKLLEWLGDSRVPAASMHLVTSTLATQTGAEGIGPTMVLSAGAQPDERSRVRGQIAAAWGMGGGADDAQVEAEFVKAAAEALDRTAKRSSDEQIELAAAVELSRLNLAARLRRAGDSGAASVAIRSAQDVLTSVQSALPQAPAATSQIFTTTRPLTQDESASGDGGWAASYLAAGQHIPLRLQRLAELEQQSAELGPIDAAVLAEAACFAQGGEGRVRAAAQRIATRHANEATMAYSLLEILPRVPRIESVSVLIEAVSLRDLPPVGDGRWMISARRALVERLIEQLAGTGRLAGTERLADLLVRSYESRPSARITSDVTPELSTDSIVAYWVSLLAEAQALVPNRAAPMPLTLIESRRAGRRAIANGPIQAWGAEQASVAELFAFVVSGEQPAAAPRVRAVMDDLVRERRDATHIFEQLKVTERAILRLWLLRLGKEDAWAGN